MGQYLVYSQTVNMGPLAGLLLVSAASAAAYPQHVEHIWNKNLFPSSQEILSRPSGRPFTISVEGNIGAGKSTLLNFFNKYPDVSVFQEPVDIWMNMNGTDYLDLLYKNITRWGMTFESLVQQSMLDVHLSDHRTRNTTRAPAVKIMERSLQSCENCFIRQIDTVIAPQETKVLRNWFDVIRKHPVMDINVDVVLYLRTDPQVIFNRVAKRNRKEELKVPLDYYKLMHSYHEDWLIHKNVTGSKYLPPVVVIDANRDLSVLQNDYKQLAKDIWLSVPKELRTNTYFKGSNRFNKQ